MSKRIVRVDNGKYTFVQDVERKGLVIEILRHGEPWHEQSDAYNALASLTAELDAARVVLGVARESLKSMATDQEVYEFVQRIRRALNRHAALVDDKEPPSDWALPGGGDL